MAIYGTPGIKGDTSWAKNSGAVRKGSQAEVKTAKILNRFSEDVAVFHDLRVPGSKGNIDHAIVAGDEILLIDTKAWRPGFLWSFGGKTRRGFKFEPSASSRFIDETVKPQYSKLFTDLGYIRKPVVVVWPSNDSGSISTWAARYHGARMVGPNKLSKIVKRMSKLGAPEPDIVAKMQKLLNK